VLDTLEAYEAGVGTGRMMVRLPATMTPLTFSGGSIQGMIDARDGALADLKTQINTLATQLITQVNNLHRNGYSLPDGAGGYHTGADFFTGSNAGNIAINQALVDDQSLIQAAGVSGAPGDNAVALSLAQLAAIAQVSLGNRTFNEYYNNGVASLGVALQHANNQVTDQQMVTNMLANRRNSVSGVSVDEEMTGLIQFQRAYQASAHLLTTVDEMIQTVLSMKS